MTEDTHKEQQLKVVNRLIAVAEARESLLPFLKLMMPDPQDPDDATKSKYAVTPQARLLCQIMEKVARGEEKRVAVSIGPQFGKSQIISRAAPAWRVGRDPYLNQILGSYNQDFANEFGFEVRNIMQSPIYSQIFPQVNLLRTGTDLLITSEGGKSAFVGVGGSGTGKPADMFVVDDPYRNAEDAGSQAFRDKVWTWFNGVVFSRCHDGTSIVVVHTRWNQDDLIGRLCDPSHPERNGLYKGLEKRWKYFNLPAVVDDPDLAKALGLTLEKPSDTITDPIEREAVIEQFGDKPMSSLWPGRKSLPLLAEAKQSDPYTFNSLYMGSPAPDDGEYFTKESLVEYEGRPPENLRVYGASDHAVSAKQRRDYSVIGCFGIDENDDIWIYPDVVWKRMQTDQIVEELLMQFKVNKPQLWWMEDELISKSFGPFLLKRMAEDRIYTTTLAPIRPAKDKETRARAIQGRVTQRRVHFPKNAPWWTAARGQLLTFPHGANDDFVDWLSLIGMGLTTQTRAFVPPEPERQATNSIGWVLLNAKRRAYQKAREKAVW